MNRLLVSWLVAGVVFAGSGWALADDTNNDRPIQTHKQMMHDCMAKEKAKAASTGQTTSTEQLKQVCRDKVKSYDNHPSETTAPPNNPG
jgi:hypothetical protein